MAHVDDRSCRHCGSMTLEWRLDRSTGVAADQLWCTTCERVDTLEDWTLPLSALRDGACWNCGGMVLGGRCRDCQLSEDEVREVHRELADLVAPGEGLLKAAGVAADQNRLCLGLKLATAAVHAGEHRPVARMLRLSLLQDLGELDAALSDCRAWIREEASDSPTAWTILAELLELSGRGALAIEAYEEALALAPDDAASRANLASLLLSAGRYAMAHEQATTVLKLDDGEHAIVARALLGAYARQLMEQGDLDAVVALLDELGPEVSRNATLTAVLSWTLLRRGALDAAKDALHQARRLDPQLDLLAQLAPGMGIKRWRWFK